MRQNEKDILLAYFYNNYIRLEEIVSNLQTNIRYRSIDSVDCVELICATERFHLFCEVCQDVRSILKLNDNVQE